VFRRCHRFGLHLHFNFHLHGVRQDSIVAESLLKYLSAS
jgi:hypothetical protein